MTVFSNNTTRRFLWFSGATLGGFLLIFIVAMLVGFDLTETAEEMKNMNSPLAMLAGISLLLADIFLPTPSSLVMIVNGALFGLWLGAFLSLLGSMGASLFGYGLGKWGSGRVEKWIGEGAVKDGKKLLKRYGVLAVMVTRPIPLLAETVAVVAGAAGMPFRKVLAGSLAGLAPTVLIYAWAGANLQEDSLGVWPFLLVFGLASLLFLFGFFRDRRKSS